MFKSINILGGPGSGCTTIGKKLAEALSLKFLDGDDFYWLQTEPPYQLKRSAPDREVMVKEAIRESNQRFVLAGSVDSWGEQTTKIFDCVVFLDCPTQVRLERLKHREISRFGSINQEFYDWAAQYEQGERPGRSLPRHTAWLKTLSCPVFKIDSSRTEQVVIAEILSKFKQAV